MEEFKRFTVAGRVLVRIFLKDHVRIKVDYRITLHLYVNAMINSLTKKGYFNLCEIHDLGIWQRKRCGEHSDLAECIHKRHTEDFDTLSDADLHLLIFELFYLFELGMVCALETTTIGSSESYTSGDFDFPAIENPYVRDYKLVYSFPRRERELNFLDKMFLKLGFTNPGKLQNKYRRVKL